MFPDSQDWQYNPEAPFAPVWGDSFMPLSPKDTLESGYINDVPALYGMVSQEGDDPVAGLSLLSYFPIYLYVYSTDRLTFAQIPLQNTLLTTIF